MNLREKIMEKPGFNNGISLLQLASHFLKIKKSLKARCGMISFLTLQLIAILAAFGCSCYMFSQAEIVEYSNRYDFLIEGNI